MKKFFFIILTILSMFFSSCYQNNSCRDFYIGDYKIDTTQITQLELKSYVINKQWDSVRLVSTDKGEYYFDTKDAELKKCEGKWWVTSNDLEGNCFGHVKQANRRGSVSTMAFNISIDINKQSYTLPFRKIK